MVGIIGKYSHTIVQIYTLMVFGLIFQQTFIMLFGSRKFNILLVLILDLNLTETFECFKDIILTVFHLDGIDDLLDLDEDVVMLRLDPSYYLLSSE